MKINKTSNAINNAHLTQKFVNCEADHKGYMCHNFIPNF